MSIKNSVPEGERYTYDYFFLDNVCRLCWGADGIVDLSSFSPKSGENEATIAEKIQECIGIDVFTHSHPKKVCSKCLNEIEIFTEFKRFCQETDRKLHGILEKGSTRKILKQNGVECKRKSVELMIVKEESDADSSNLVIDDSIEDFFDDFPLSCETNKNTDQPVRKKRRKRTNYCNFCHLNLESIEKFTEHNLECHGIEENGVYKCFGCEKKFNNVKKRLRHESGPCKEMRCGYKCNICDIFLPKRRLYEHHMRAHRENKKIELPDILHCKKCMKPFENSECLQDHILTHYQKEKKSYVCDTCGRVFTRRDYLHKHKLVHEGGKHQKCPHCDYRTVQRSSLTVHIRKHTGERPYPCDMCAHRCVTSSNLREHRKRHFGIKAFECKLCEKKFGYKISLEEHMCAVHAQSEAHACVQCGAAYSRIRGLRRHLLAKHGKKVKKVKDDLIEVQNGHTEILSHQINIQNGQTDVPHGQKVQNDQTEAQNGQIKVLNGETEGQNGQVKVQISEVQNETNDATMVFLEEKNCSVENTDGAVFISSPIIIL